MFKFISFVNLNKNKIMETLVIGIIMLTVGIALYYWISRRKFYRRNVAGIEGFSSFEASVIVRLLERLGRWISYILIIFGILSLFAYNSIRKKEKAKTEVVKPE
ncbi:molybdenum ABC transporter permease [Elizabethkingia anophelis]|uniref:molybdenum ABC transporter permease n=1 Tax=Elizabethkingia anophelis TaxID=1117645 RepID=UPI00063BDDBE|nr:molybdenum ABC transporter permease [Elizabethkingia anophelis]AKH95205.1 hypothetical protein M876_11570 [Elizabethkingia anophelis FMS-007]